MSSSSTKQDDYLLQEQGQLRYWTSDMCSRSPHLFDFVVTVRSYPHVPTVKSFNTLLPAGR